LETCGWAKCHCAAQLSFTRAGLLPLRRAHVPADKKTLAASLNLYRARVGNRTLNRGAMLSVQSPTSNRTHGARPR
jgi:hypothetical protein